MSVRTNNCKVLAMIILHETLYIYICMHGYMFVQMLSTFSIIAINFKNFLNQQYVISFAHINKYNKVDKLMR